MSGVVHIVGAGPGAADLLSLRALRRIEAAEVVVHDRLISDEIMALLPAAAERIDVGKAAGRHLVAQERIHEILIERARAGQRVLRLKGGDPFVFGRGGEEMLALQAAGIAFELVPGISAANGCAAAAGIPLTQRGMASACIFLAGHLADEQTPFGQQLDWAALARPGQTRVFYMGIERLARIAAQLQLHGLSPATPAAIVQDGTRASQRVLALPLQQLVAQAPAYGPRPGLLIIGETVALSPAFAALPGTV